MGRIWYECRLNFDIISIVPFILLGVMILLSIILINNLKKKGLASALEVKRLKIIFSSIIHFN